MQLTIENTKVPKGIVDVVLDTDTYNEVDDQFALAYMLKSKERFNVKAIYAAPFFNQNSTSPKDGMEKSYDEIHKILQLVQQKVEVFKGAENYLVDKNMPVISPASKDLAKRALKYSPEKPLYVVAIGAITNVASAIILEPKIVNNIVLVWLGGHAHHYTHTQEFNMKQDMIGAKIVMTCGAPFIQLPCRGVVDAFTISRVEFEYYFKGKTELSDYLATHAIEQISAQRNKKDWSKIIWDVCAVAYLLNDDDRFMLSRIIPAKIPSTEKYYIEPSQAPFIRYVYSIKRDEILSDLVEKLTKK